eukprot:tig00000383_g24676.t1
MDDAELDAPVEEHPRLTRGALQNGFSYIVLENSTPPERVSCFLQVRVGSLNEAEDQQGIAHYLEHVVFLGTEKYESSEVLRRKLARLGMSFGGDTNAFTDFRQTVYTLSAPTRGSEDDESEEARQDDGEGEGDGEENLGVCIEILHELAFRAKIEEGGVESERGAILSEVAMRNTIDNRLTVAMFKQQHPETALPNRFPIGQEEQIKGWSAADVRAFYERHYAPENMSLVVVGDAAAELPAAPRGPPPVEHRFGALPPAPLVIYESDLLKAVTFTFAVKLPMAPLQRRRDLLWQICDTVCGMALDARTEALLQGHEGAPCPFQSLSWSYSDSTREACAVNSLTVTALPQHWRPALQAAVREAVRLAAHGLTPEEYEHSVAQFMKESELAAEQDETLDSEDLMESLLGDLEGGSLTLSRTETLRQYRALLPRLSLEMVNRRAAELYNLVLAFPRTYELVARAGPEAVAGPWGVGQGLLEGGFPAPRPAAESDYYLLSPSLLFVYGPPSLSEVAGPDADGSGRPVGLTAEAVAALVAATVAEGAEAPARQQIPQHIVDPAGLEARLAACAPAFVPIDDPRLSGPEAPADLRLERAAALAGEGPLARWFDPVGGYSFLALSNGIRVAYRRTDFERKQVQFRVASPGGRALERDPGVPAGAAPELEDSAAISVGLRCCVEGAAGGLAPEIVSRWAALRGVGLRGGADSERLCVTLSCSVTDGGVASALELLHGALAEPAVHAGTFARVLREELLACELLEKNPERLALNNMFRLLSEPQGDGRLVALERRALEALTPERCLRAVARHLRSLEVSVVGDFEPEELERALLRFLGTLPLPELPAPPPLAAMRRELRFSPAPREWRGHVGDAENARAVLALGFPSSSKWGEASGVSFAPFAPAWPADPPRAPPPAAGEGAPWAEAASVRGHPLYVVRVLTVVHELVNNRLYADVREKKSLLYSASMSSLHFEFMGCGVSYILAGAFPDKVEVTLGEIRRVLEELREAGPSPAEFQQALRPLVETVRTALASSNDFHLNAMLHLATPGSRKSLHCVRHIAEFYQRLTIEDVRAVLRAYFPSSTPLATSVVTSGPAPSQSTTDAN